MTTVKLQLHKQNRTSSGTEFFRQSPEIENIEQYRDWLSEIREEIPELDEGWLWLHVVEGSEFWCTEGGREG